MFSVFASGNLELLWNRRAKIEAETDFLLTSPDIFINNLGVLRLWYYSRKFLQSKDIRIPSFMVIFA